MTTPTDMKSAAKALLQYHEALTLLHTYFDDARQRGLPPHHAITSALSRLAGQDRAALDAVGVGEPIWVVFDTAPRAGEDPVAAYRKNPGPFEDRYEVRRYVPG